ncbi:small multi-drug export protein [Lentibacillus sp. CBA3610]|uniref:small multi-drug export protein n=1 Tax=Lentibacillus sp. CBA3610 TaxID=2518176 RepID=UPI001595D3E1|nr:small multi-drug export protein [Lentibacillus sp. CBA3610]QKY71066.1 DNA-binding protein [Lentibacillus sp. CBA3610]
MFIYVAAYVLIFLLGATPFMEILGVIPIGVAAGLPAIPVSVVAFLGNMSTIWLLILLAERVKTWLKKRREKKEKEKESSAKRGERGKAIWKKYGLPGLAIVAPILVGSHLAAVVAIGAGGERRQIFLWMTISIIIWTIATGIASHYGIDYLFNQTGYEGFLNDLLDME